jgi:hypothetical protein
MSESSDFILFENTSFSDLMKDIYTATKKKENQIDILVEQLKPLVNNLDDATVVVPLLKEYLEVGVKNDEQLVKLAAVVQRFHAALQRGDKGAGEDGFLSEDEKLQLLQLAEEEVKEIQEQVNESIIREKEV